MNDNSFIGKVAFVNHEKKYAIIEYEEKGKKKTINGSIDEKVQQQLKDAGLIKKAHQFHIGDAVHFTIAQSERRDRMVATNIQFRYNTALDVLINKAHTENKFTGYLKIADDKYFVKEIDSYLFFPVLFSAWQIKPTEAELNEPVFFSLENLEKKEKIAAALFNKSYIPEYYTAIKMYKNKTPIEAVVYKISPHGIYLNLVGDKIQSKIPLAKKGVDAPATTDVKIGETIKVIITHLGSSRIVVEPVDRLRG